MRDNRPIGNQPGVQGTTKNEQQKTDYQASTAAYRAVHVIYDYLGPLSMASVA